MSFKQRVETLSGVVECKTSTSTRGWTDGHRAADHVGNPPDDVEKQHRACIP